MIVMLTTTRIDDQSLFEVISCKLIDLHCQDLCSIYDKSIINLNTTSEEFDIHLPINLSISLNLMAPVLMSISRNIRTLVIFSFLAQKDSLN